MQLQKLHALSGNLPFSEGFKMMSRRHNREVDKKMNGVDVARGENRVKGGECGKHELEIVLDLQETTDKMYLWHRMSDSTRRKKKIENHHISCYTCGGWLN